MTISESLKLGLQKAFEPSHARYSTSDGIWYSTSIIVSDVSGYLFVPSIINSIVPNCITTTDFVVSLSTPSTVVKKTADSIITFLFNRNRYNESRICKIDTTKGYEYYGGKGIILDGDCRPLIICGTVNKNTLNNPSRSCMCLISPRVFNREDVVSKAIIKKIIPYLSSYEHPQRGPVRVLISEDIDNVIHRVRPPEDLDFNSIAGDVFNEFVGEL